MWTRPRPRCSGIAPGTVDRVVRLAVAGESVGDFLDSDGEAYPITLRLPLVAHHAPDILDEIYIPTASGAAVPLAQIAALRFDASPARIDRYRSHALGHRDSLRAIGIS